MSAGNEDDVDMAECGVCRAVVPINSDNCPGCGVSFSGVSDEALGECGACKTLIPLDSESCTHCGVTFVADNVVEVLGNWLTATGLGTRDLFEKFDTDGDGKITSEEFKNGLLSLKLADLPPSQIDRLVTAIDEDGNGIIDLDELSNTFGEANEPLKDVADKETEDGAEDTDPTDSDSADDSTEEDADESEDEADDEDDSEESDDEAEEEESDDEADEEESDDVAEEKEEDDEFTRFGKAIVAAGYTIKEVFERLDTNDDGRIDGPELQSGLADILGEDLVPSDVFSILKSIDKDEDGNIDAMEIIEALENLDLGIESDKTDIAVEKEFPSQLQKFLMGKKANDIFYPICYFLAFAFITIWIINGLGLIVDGTGGNIVYNGHTDADGIEWDQGDYNICTIMPDMSNCQGYVTIGDTYPCDPVINDDGCANSLTPLMEYSSMPAGFYGDGIFMIIIGLFGFAGILFLHLVYAPSVKAKVRALNREDEEGLSDEEVEGESSEDDSQESDDSEEEDSEDSEDSEDDEGAGDTDADIDIGSNIGLVLEDEEFYGVIIEFDDDEGLVTIETENGDEITGYQDDMFIE